MNPELKDYINGKINVVQDEFILSRERTGKNELIFVNSPGTDAPMYALWNSRKDAKAHKVKKTDEGYVIEKVKNKGTGGELSYVMVILKNLEAAKELSMEAAGLFLKLLPYVEWNTCRLMRKRDKASLTQSMIVKYFSIGINKTKRLISELCKSGMLEFRSKAYYVSGDLIRKGRSVCD